MRGSRGRRVVGRLVAFAALPRLGGRAGGRADPLPAHAPRIADYDITVRLDADAKRLDGTLRLTWRNPSADSVPDLWFHLYLNAFRDRDSTFWRESRGQLRGVPMPDDGWGRIDVTAHADRRRRRPAAGADVRGARRRQPPRTARWRASGCRSRSPPGRPASISTSRSRAALPKAYARTGYAGDYFLVGAVVPEDGRLRAGRRRAAAPPAAGTRTSSTPTRSSTPTSATTASPSRCRAASSSAPPASAPRASTTATARTTHTYEQGDVHDFAWTASPRFVEITRRFDAATEVPRARRIARPRRGSGDRSTSCASATSRCGC